MTRMNETAPRRRAPVRLGMVVAAIVLVADQYSKFLVLHGLDLGLGERLVVAPFVDFVLTYNRGISYGLFQQDGEFGRWFLVVLKLAAAGLFAYWLARSHSRVVAASLGLLIGGAIGNALDRMVYGAVIDFVSLHAFGWRWYVFNLADTAIVAGVLGLLYDAVKGSVTKSPPSG
jgi:signal peptidase II